MLVVKNHVGEPKQTRSLVTLPRRVRDADLPRRTAHLRRQHREEVQDRMPEGEPAELPGVAGVGDSIPARETSQPRSRSTPAIASATRRLCSVWV